MPHLKIPLHFTQQFLGIILIALVSGIMFLGSIRVAHSSTTVATVAPTETPWYTPYPTDKELIAQLNTLLAPRDNCILPCLLGLEPGKSTIVDIKNFVKNHPLKTDFHAPPPYEIDGVTAYDYSMGLAEIGVIYIRFATVKDEFVYSTLLRIQFRNGQTR